MAIATDQLRRIIEAALMAASEPLTITKLLKLFSKEEQPEKSDVQAVLQQLESEYAGRGIELKKVASGYCFKVSQSVGPWIANLWHEKPPRYSRAFLETLALIAYRQPITRAEIENVRGVAVSAHIIKTLTERGWIRVIGHKDVPGRPSLYATAKEFLDYFSLSSLTELPPLETTQDIDQIAKQLEIDLTIVEEPVQVESV